MNSCEFDIFRDHCGHYMLDWSFTEGAEPKFYCDHSSNTTPDGRCNMSRCPLLKNKAGGGQP